VVGAGVLDLESSGFYGESQRWAQSDAQIADLGLLAGQLGAEALHGQVRVDCLDLDTPTWAGSDLGTVTLLGNDIVIDEPNIGQELELDVGGLAGISGNLALFAHDDNLDSAEEDEFVAAELTMVGIDATVNLLGLSQNLQLHIGDLAAFAPCDDMVQQEGDLTITVDSDADEPVSAGDVVT